jgi:bifunctional UDP-N-acetylglucosamine pyrophosphorylase/glucosamine-1-phosphate N-acetyltransferase
MLPIANKPILEHLLIEVREAGIKEFVFIVGYHDEQVRDYFGDGRKWGVSIEYCNQRWQFGTADALRVVEGVVDGNFLMINGDVLVKRRDIKGVTESENTTMSVIEVTDTKGLGLVESKRGRVVRIYEKVEKPPSNLANAGLYLFTPEIFKIISRTPKSPRGEFEITDSLQMMIDGGQYVSCKKIGYWLDLSYPWHLLPANESLLSGIKSQSLGEIEENVAIKGAVCIGMGTVVRSGSYIVGPVIIGENCEAGPNCYIRPFTAIGDNCHIGAAVEVKNSIIMRGTKIPHISYVGDSVIGEDCNLGAGTKIANLRLDEKDVWVADNNTGRRKLGAIIGDGVKTGINASINVGTLIGSNTHIGPGAVASGVIAPNSTIL